MFNKVFKKEDLIPEVMKIADRLCNTHLSSLSNSKKILNNTMRKQLATALDEEQEQFMQVYLPNKFSGVFFAILFS